VSSQPHPWASPANRARLAEEINPRSIPLFVLSLILSLIAARLLLQHGQSMATFPWLAYLTHLLASILTGAGIAVALGRQETARHGWALFLGVFAFLAGPVGVIGGILSYLMARGQPTRTPLTEVVKAEMFVTMVPDEEPEEVATLDLKIREQAQVEPFIDMLPMADVATAIAIVNRLRERGRRQDIEMIRQISADPRPEVYQYALAILDKMERAFASQVCQLQEEIHLHPRRASLRVAMAKLHLDYVQSGLLDESLHDYYWELTLCHLFEAMLVTPQRPELGADLAQLLALQGLYERAGAVATVVLKKNPAMLQAQLLVVQSLYERALRDDNPSGVLLAKRAALESAWAIHLPKKRTATLGPAYDLAHFWFGDRDA
jgi:hypothetical protein